MQNKYIGLITTIGVSESVYNDINNKKSDQL